jgi:hypothetical protein
MQRFWRFSPWLSRALLLAITALFALIGWKYLSDPAGNAAADEIALGSVMALSRIRVGFGAFPLGFALILLWCLVSADRLLHGLIAVATVIGVVAVARASGILIDGSAEEAFKLLRVEAIVFALSVAGIFLERARARHSRTQAAGS